MTIAADCAQTLSYVIELADMSWSQCCEVAGVFHHAVRAMAGQEYSQAQCRAWSPSPRDPRYWRSRLRRSLVLVARVQDEVVGFIDCELDFTNLGYIGHLYVAPPYQRQGIAAALLMRLIDMAPAHGIANLSTDASRSSRSLFLTKGFCSKGRSFQRKSGEILEGFAMALSLPFFVDDMVDGDLAGIAKLVHASVQAAGSYYSEAERLVWSPAALNAGDWAVRLARSRVWIARAEQGPVGLINLLPTKAHTGEIDYLYVHPSIMRRGVATALYRALAADARQRRITLLTVEASLMARPFFLTQGFSDIRRNEHARGAEVLVNYTMLKRLD